MTAFFMLIFFPVLTSECQSGFDARIAAAAKQLTCFPPDEQNPVSLNAQLVSEGDSIAIILKVSMAPGWHIYAYVPSTQPYIAIDQILQLPGNVKAVGGWTRTEPETSSADVGVLIYDDQALFIHKAVRSAHQRSGNIIRTGLYYQTCNLRQCLPPVEKIFELKY